MPAASPVFHVDAFSTRAFGGNAAAVVLCATPLGPSQYQSIAAEFNLSETAFVIADKQDKDAFSAADGFHLRWFTPTNEVSLCGHATLAAAHVLIREVGNASKALTFNTLSGPLVVSSANGRLRMSFPHNPSLTLCFPWEKEASAAGHPLTMLLGHCLTPIAQDVEGLKGMIHSLHYNFDTRKLLVRLGDD